LFGTTGSRGIDMSKTIFDMPKITARTAKESLRSFSVDLERGLTDIQKVSLKTVVEKGYIISPKGGDEEFHVVMDMPEQRMRHGTDGMKKNLKMANEIIRGLVSNNYRIYSVIIGYKTVVVLRRWPVATTVNETRDEMARRIFEKGISPDDF